MGTRGRRSAAELTVARTGPVDVVPRPDAPYDLTDEQTEEWWAVVNRMPADWFPRETHGLLAQYCRHVVSARRVAQLITDAEGQDALDLNRLDQLYKMQEREGRALSSLATRMRITQQTTYDKSRKKPVETRKPWE
jgi:hypothetical protein